MNTSNHTRRGGIFSLLGVVLVLGIGVGVGIYYVLGKEGVINEIEKIVGPAAVQGRVLSAKNGSDRSLDTYALVKLDTQDVYESGDFVQIARDKAIIAEAQIEKRTESGNYMCRVAPEKWKLPEDKRVINEGDLVYAKAKAAKKDSVPAAGN